MNLTLSVDATTLNEARQVAQRLGKSVNQLVREYLQSLRGQDALEEALDELETLSLTSGGQRGTWRFNRDSIHARP